MTFSDSRVVNFVRDHFIPVWESVCPVKTVTFDLGEGKSLHGTVGGEIAIYFCRPDGKVFDILPALHSPSVTYQAIRNAFDFYTDTGAKDEAIATYHETKLAEMILTGAGIPSELTRMYLQVLKERRKAKDPATRDLSEMVYSKSGMAFPERLTVVEPGGLEMYKKEIHKALASSSPKTPGEWAEHIFEKILHQELVGGPVEYGADTLAPVSIIGD